MLSTFQRLKHSSDLLQDHIRSRLSQKYLPFDRPPWQSAKPALWPSQLSDPASNPFYPQATPQAPSRTPEFPHRSTATDILWLFSYFYFYIINDISNFSSLLQ